MKKTRVVLIDDEDSARGTLKAILTQYFDDKVEIVGEGEDVASGIEAIKANNPELVFLDIKMPDGTGFDLLQEIGSENFEVIFTTAYDNYAIKAFEASAMGYLMKPIDIDKLSEILDKAIKVIQQPSDEDEKEKKIGVLLENYSSGSGKVKKIVIPGVDGFEVIEIDKLVRCEGERNYTSFVFVDGSKILTSTTLKQYEISLEEYGFFRIHKSHLINLNHVKKYIKANGGSVEMSDNSSLQISKDKKELFIQRFL